MDERTKEAYRRVLTDILNRDLSLFVGRYDATNGNEHFMYGICTVMEFIAFSADEKCYEAFQDIWNKNMNLSEKNKRR